MKLAHFFLNIDMRCTHEGLMAVVKKQKIEIKPGEFVVFMNRSRTMVKMFCGSNKAILHYRGEKQLDPGIIQHLPKFCGGSEMDVASAVREHLHGLMKRRGYKVEETPKRGPKRIRVKGTPNDARAQV